MFGSIISGMTDGLMYAVEGPIITCAFSLATTSNLIYTLSAYPEPDRRGRMLGLWVFMRNAAPVIGAFFSA
jgi:hypothetical protein